MRPATRGNELVDSMIASEQQFASTLASGTPTQATARRARANDFSVDRIGLDEEGYRRTRSGIRQSEQHR